MNKKNLYLSIILIIILFIFFSGCSETKTSTQKNVKSPVISESNFSNQYEYAVNLFNKSEYEDAIIIFSELYLIRDKNPLLSEDLSIYLFVSIVYLNYISEEKLESILPYLSKKFNLKKNPQDLYDYLYSNYLKEFYYSTKKGIMLFFRLISYYVQKLFLVFISRYENLTETDIKTMDSEQQNFLLYIYSYSYLMIENPAKAKTIINDFIKSKNREIPKYFYNILAYITIQYSKDLVEYSEYEKLMGDPQDSGILLYSILNPLSVDYVKKEREKILFIIFHNDEIFKKSAVYAIGALKGFIFVGTFLDGIYLYDESRNLIQLIQTSNSNLYSNLIRDFHTYESRILICTYEGINVVDFSNIDLKKYSELSFAKRVQYIKSNLIVSRLSIFPYGKKYSSIYEDEKYIIATTHYNGIYIYNKKKKDLMITFENHTIEKAIAVGDTLFVATYQKGAYIYDISNRNILYSLFKDSDVKYVYKKDDFIYILTYKDGVYRAKISDKSAQYGAFSLLLGSEMVSYAKSCVVIKDNIYIGSLKNGLYSFNLINNRFQVLNTKNNFFSDNITSLYDYNGYLLIASLSDGIAIYNKEE